MKKGVSKELRDEIQYVLSALLNAEPATSVAIVLKTPNLERDAINYLRDIRALEDTGTGSYRLTAYGREYWERINTPAPWYWFKQNWFGASVAAATIAASVGGIVFNALD